jgi:hypothetical protein
MDNQTSLPFAAGSETSREAAERMAEQPTRIRRDHESILNVLLSGPKTDKEIQSILNMSGDTQRPRRGELVAMGRVVNTGQRRERSTLWAIA